MSDDQTPPPPGDDTGTTPPPPPAPPLASRPLLRRDDHKHIAGVAGGIADYLGLDATIIRVGFVVLTVFGGIGIPLYLVGWIAIPSPAMPQSYAERWFGGSPNPAALVAVGIGLVILLANLDHQPGEGLGWGLLLLFAGWLLFRSDTRARSAVPFGAPADTVAPWAPAGGWQGPGGVPAPAPAWVPIPPPPRQPRSILGRLTFGAGLAALGIAALLDNGGVIDVTAQQYFALALIIVGLGLIVGAWVGRAYGLIPLGLVLIPILLAATVGPVPLGSGVGEDTFQPATVAEVQSRYSLGVGQLELDFSDVDFAGTTTDVDVSVGIGETEIIVPDDTTVTVDGDMQAGRTEVFGLITVGRPLPDLPAVTDEGLADAGRLQLHVSNGVGLLTVRRDSEEL